MLTVVLTEEISSECNSRQSEIPVSNQNTYCIYNMFTTSQPTYPHCLLILNKNVYCYFHEEDFCLHGAVVAVSSYVGLPYILSEWYASL